MLADLWEGLSPLMRVCGFGGLAAGMLFGLRLIGAISPSGPSGAGRLLWWIACTCAVVGAVLGLALGAALELLLGKRSR